jgi:hypothetical protein
LHRYPVSVLSTTQLDRSDANTMPTSRYIDQCPEFPSDVPIANIPRLSFRELEVGSVEEVKKLFQACTDFGFFLLDLKGVDQGETLLNEAETLFDLTTTTLTLDREVLNNYAYQAPKSLLG